MKIEELINFIRLYYNDRFECLCTNDKISIIDTLYYKEIYIQSRHLLTYENVNLMIRQLNKYLIPHLRDEKINKILNDDSGK